MSNEPNAPPLFRLTPLAADADLTARACRAAAGGADPATLFWADRLDRAVSAVVLAPEQPLKVAAQMTYVGMLALGDALGAVLPALMVVSHWLPGEFRLNDARLGALRLLAPEGCGPDEVPDWLVLTADIAISKFEDGSAEAADLTITTLEDEGCMGIAPAELTGAFARYLLAAIDRWQTDGLAPVLINWGTRAPALGDEVALRLAGKAYAGRYKGIAENGDVLLEPDQRIPAVELVER